MRPRKKEDMGFSKSYGPVVISEAAGNFTIAINDTISVGGGAMKGIIKATGTAQAEVSGAILAEAGLEYLKLKFPQFASEIDVVEKELAIEIAKL